VHSSLKLDCEQASEVRGIRITYLVHHVKKIDFLLYLNGTRDNIKLVIDFTVRTHTVN